MKHKHPRSNKSAMLTAFNDMRQEDIIPLIAQEYLIRKMCLHNRTILTNKL